MSNTLEATARIKINKLLEEAGWRFFDTAEGKANISLESNVKFEELGDDLEKAKGGLIDFLLLDDRGYPLVVLEAKKESIDPLSAKEQARRYAIANKVNYIILSNGNVHYFWNIDEGNPELISNFPTPKSLQNFTEFTPNPERLYTEQVNDDYIALTILSNYAEPRELEKRILIDTYTTFGCERGVPTVRYILAQGAKDGNLVQPTVIDARTDVTTKLLSDEGYSALVTLSNESGEEVSEEVQYKLSQFEKKFFSDITNRVFVQTFVDNAWLDPIINEIGKILVFADSQKHAAKLTQLLNINADNKWPNKYKSDFAVQVTSNLMNS